MRGTSPWNDVEPASWQQLKKNEQLFFHSELMNRKQVWGGRQYHGSGHVKPTHDTLRSHLHEGSFSILTAHNPMAQKLTPFQNALRNNVLEKELKDTGAVYHKIKGKYGNEEDSFLIHHTASLSPAKAEELAKNHGQESLLHSSKGRHQLKYVNGPNTGTAEHGSGYTFDPNLHDFYSQLPGKPETKWQAHLGKADDFKKLGYEFEMEDGKKHTIHFHFGK
jgi:hypothetical protein